MKAKLATFLAAVTLAALGAPALTQEGGVSITDIRQETTDRSTRIVVECSGGPSGFELGRSLLRPRGTLVLKSTYADSLTVDMSRIVVDEITLAT